MQTQTEPLPMHREQPPPPSDGDWRSWTDEHYPFSERWAKFLRINGCRIDPSDQRCLEYLRGVPRDGIVGNAASELASLWFYQQRNPQVIAKRLAKAREVENYAEKRRLISLARQALDGTLGRTRQEKADAQATAQHFIGQRRDPSACSFDDLNDWFLMHRYQCDTYQGRNPPKPVLARDRKAREELSQDVSDSIGAYDYQGSLF